jgi:hypothetical protein
MSAEDSLSDSDYKPKMSRERGLNIIGKPGPNLGRA